MAVAPLILGLGSRAGNQSDSFPPAGLLRTASGPLPPRDRASAEGTAAGLSIAPAGRKAALTGTQRPCCWTRTGSTLIVRVNVPSGLATVTEVSVVSADTTAGRPAAAAAAEAADIAAALGIADGTVLDFLAAAGLAALDAGPAGLTRAAERCSNVRAAGPAGWACADVAVRTRRANALAAAMVICVRRVRQEPRQGLRFTGPLPPRPARPADRLGWIWHGVGRYQSSPPFRHRES